MAEGGTVTKQCWFYSIGNCRNGSDCRFSHTATTQLPSETVCRYFLQQQCRFGDRCRLLHTSAPAESHGDQTGDKTTQSSEATNSNQPQQSASHSNSPNRTESNSGTVSTSAMASSNTTNPPTGIGRMTVLKKPVASEGSRSTRQEPSQREPSPNWINAPEFVPRGAVKSYADVLKPDTCTTEMQYQAPEEEIMNPDVPLCPFAEMGECPYGDRCKYLHGNVCDLCGRACLNPFDEEQQKIHREECIKEHERDMELSFAIQRSIDKSCGICMDNILEKEPPTERRFGILEKCTHIFCLNCIRKWRGTKQFDSRTIRNGASESRMLTRACPECRVNSDFVVPSKFWVEAKEDKEKLIADYKKALSSKPCKYFKQGRGECPFAGACFYLHAYPDGRKAELPPPRPRRRQNQDGELETMEHVVLWDFLELRDDHFFLHLDLDEMLDLFSDTDDESDWSDFEILID